MQTISKYQHAVLQQIGIELYESNNAVQVSESKAKLKTQPNSTNSTSSVPQKIEILESTIKVVGLNIDDIQLASAGFDNIKIDNRDGVIQLSHDQFNNLTQKEFSAADKRSLWQILAKLA